MKIVIEVVIEDLDTLGAMQAALAILESVQSEVGYGAGHIISVELEKVKE